MLKQNADPTPVVGWAAKMWAVDVLRSILDSPAAKARLDLGRRAGHEDDAASLAVLSRNVEARLSRSFFVLFVRGWCCASGST